MTVELTGMSGIQARVSAIESQLASMSASASTASTASATSSSNGAAFASALTSATADTSSASATSGATTAVDSVLLATGTSTGTSAEKLIAAARAYLGVPYKWGGTNPTTGLDCSGFVQRAFKDIGITLPRVSSDQARCGTKVASLAEAKPGDLVAFDSPVDHIGIYLGDNKMIVAPKSGDVVKIQTIYKTPSAIRRVLPEQVGAGAALSASSISGGASSIPSGSALAAAPAAYRSLFLAAQSRYGVPATLLASVAKAESGFNPNAVSPAGARGLMQIMPSTARSLGVNPNDPGQAVDGAARLLRDNLRTFGSTELAVAAYNAGAGAVQRYGGIPPYAETRTYVRRVLSDSGVRAA